MPTEWGLPQLLSMLFSGVSMVVVLGAVWGLATKLATMSALLQSLAPLPARVAVLEREMAVMQKDMHHLWEAWRADCAERQAEGGTFAQFLVEWDKRQSASAPTTGGD